jgi:hypothetical protein
LKGVVIGRCSMKIGRTHQRGALGMPVTRMAQGRETRAKSRALES